MQVKTVFSCNFAHPLKALDIHFNIRIEYFSDLLPKELHNSFLYLNYRMTDELCNIIFNSSNIEQYLQLIINIYVFTVAYIQYVQNETNELEKKNKWND